MNRVTLSTHPQTKYHSVEIDGYVQPFGAIFFNKRGDIKRYVEAAVKTMNRALSSGETGCQIRGIRYMYAVDFTPLLNSAPGRYPNQIKLSVI